MATRAHWHPQARRLPPTPTASVFRAPCGHRPWDSGSETLCRSHDDMTNHPPVREEPHLAPCPHRPPLTSSPVAASGPPCPHTGPCDPITRVLCCAVVVMTQPRLPLCSRSRPAGFLMQCGAEPAGDLGLSLLREDPVGTSLCLVPRASQTPGRPTTDGAAPARLTAPRGGGSDPQAAGHSLLPPEGRGRSAGVPIVGTQARGDLKGGGHTRVSVGLDLSGPEPWPPRVPAAPGTCVRAGPTGQQTRVRAQLPWTCPGGVAGRSRLAGVKGRLWVRNALSPRAAGHLLLGNKGLHFV